MRSIKVSLAVAAVLVASVSGAQEQAPVLEPVLQTEIYTEPTPIERTPPSYPVAALMDRREGWALVSFIITEQGDVIEPMIEDSSDKAFENPSLRAIEKWRYNPATRGGKPIEQGVVQTMIRYKLEDSQGANPVFARKYRTIQRLITEKQLPEAKEQLDELGMSDRRNFYELAWFAWIQYLYLQATGTAATADLIEALQQAVGYEEDYLTGDMFVAASQGLFALHARSGDFSKALAAYDRLTGSKAAKESHLYEEVVAAMNPPRDQILALVDSDRVLQLKASIDDTDYWVHNLLRRSFAVTGIQGRLEMVDIRCTAASRRFQGFQDGTTWTIPTSWGECGVYIKGEVGATFTLEEYSERDAAAAEAARSAPSQ